ncbi:MAG TPA: prolipoprotein diacylglyceryl transferase [Candidatus Nanoarchaeia archaeon]
MIPVLFEIGPVTIYSFGFFLTLAYLVATFILWREGKRQGYNEEKLLDLSVISLVAALVGGRFYFLLLNWSLFADEPTSAFAFWQGGFAYHGSLVAAMLVAVYFVKRWKWSFFQIADIASLSGAAAMVLGKIGAFLAGLDYGKETTLPWAVSLPGLIGARHPVQLYEAAGYFLIFIIIYLLYFRNLASPNMKSGKIFLTFLISSSLVRAWLEFFRADSAVFLSVPVATLVSAAIAAGAIFALYYFQIRDFSKDARAFLGSLLGLNSRILRKIKF